MRNAIVKYDPSVELEQGADLTAVSYDPTQRALVMGGKVTIGGRAVTAEISGVATGKGLDGMVNLWLSKFYFRKPDGSVNAVSDLNVPAPLKPHQGAIDTARKLASFINASKRPYKAKAQGSRRKATLSIVYAQA